MANEAETPNTNPPADKSEGGFTPPPVDQPVEPETSETSEGESTDQPKDGKVLPPAPSHQRGRFKRMMDWFAIHKKTSLVLILILLLAVLGGVPFTRYKLVGLVWKQNFQVELHDQQTGAVVTSADVTLAGKHATTDKDGRVTFKAKPGPATLAVNKRYYQATTKHVVVSILKQKKSYRVNVQATGRQVPVTVRNAIGGKPVANATIKAAGTEAKTDKNGKVTMVLPADKKTVTATVTASGFNKTTGTIAVSAQTLAANTLTITPTGKVYFLSNQSGKIDVVKTNLDGTGRQTVLAGTGNEQARQTVLLASRDWKYLALKAVRDTSGKPKLYLINTATDKLTTMDEGNAEFTQVGWYNHHFIYSVNRLDIQPWQDNRVALKSYNADTGQLSTIDQTQGVGTGQDNYATQYFDNFYILPNQVVYSVVWSNVSPTTGNLEGRTAAIRGITPSGQGKKDYKTFDAKAVISVGAKLYEPGGVYFAVYPREVRISSPDFYEFSDNAVKQATGVSEESLQNAYPTYILSPDGNQMFWSDPRDGKNALFVGDKNAKNSKQLASLSDYGAYGWFTDNYVLLSKNGSELAIMSTSGGTPQKISDYYKPVVNFNGYGYGYGGL